MMEFLIVVENGVGVDDLQLVAGLVVDAISSASTYTVVTDWIRESWADTFRTFPSMYGVALEHILSLLHATSRKEAKLLFGDLGVLMMLTPIVAADAGAATEVVTPLNKTP
ncbi:unnamed protein product [Sphagnum troendelagicum]|uniref:Uncharacterized protein n=1 Tax=Sphagnum troendelagicum TaxID=128251 RepID=A0ABP0U2Y9_9BRYO